MQCCEVQARAHIGGAVVVVVVVTIVELVVVVDKVVVHYRRTQFNGKIVTRALTLPE